MSWSTAHSFGSFDELSPLESGLSYEPYLKTDTIKDDPNDPFLREKVLPILRQVRLIMLLMDDLHVSHKLITTLY